MSNALLKEMQTRFLRLKFGMFIHFGLYSQGKEHEWHMWIHNMNLHEYKHKFLSTFDVNPEAIEQWVVIAKSMGAKYLVVTSKHCDGFCLWDTQFLHILDPEYQIRATPFFQKHQRSVLDILIEAGKKHGIEIGLYHSVVDWSLNEKSSWFRRRTHWIRDPKLYEMYKQNLHNRLLELLEMYPSVFYLWLDAYPLIPNGYARLDYEGLYRALHAKKPEILVGINKAATAFHENQLSVPEDVLIMENMAHKGEFNPIPADRPPMFKGMLVEVCLTLNNHWGYNEVDKNYKDLNLLAALIRKNVENGGNTLLNFGPGPDGFIAEDQVELAHRLGQLLRERELSA